MNRRNGMGGLPTWHCQLSFGKICVLHIFTFTGNVSVPSALVTAIGLQTLGTMFILDTAEGKVETSCCFYLTFVYEFLVGISKHRHRRTVLIKTPFHFNFSSFKTLLNYMKLPESASDSHTWLLYRLMTQQKFCSPLAVWHLFQYQGLGGLSGFPNCLGWKFWGLFDEEIKSQSEFYAGMLSLSWLVQQMWGCAPQTNRQKRCILCTVHINKTQLCKKKNGWALQYVVQ